MNIKTARFPLDNMLRLSLVIAVLCFCPGMAQDLISVFANIVLGNGEPDCTATTTGLILSKGYPVEEHRVLTKDGYILTVHRIPHGKFDNKTEGKPPAFIQHGLLSTSADWVINYDNNSLGFILADQGYDVWLGNFRGSTYSREHATLSQENPDFWEFSWDQMAAYDLPATIDFILKKTHNKQLLYIGHSLGTTTMFALLSSKPQYQEKIKLFVALAPITKLPHTKSPIAQFHRIAFLLTPVTGFLKTKGKLCYDSDLIRKAFHLSCGNFVTRNTICKALLFFIDGQGTAHLNTSRLEVYFSHFPSGTSVNTVVHYAQSIASDEFKMYDRGFFMNYKIYGQSKPPIYDITKIQTPVVLISSHHDVFANPKDVDYCRNELPNIVDDIVVVPEDFTHADFVYAVDAGQFVYKYIVKHFNNLSFKAVENVNA